MILIIIGILLLQLAKCHSDIHPRLRRSVGGSPASIAKYPYVVSIRSAGGHICGGTIVSETIVLTASHCILPDTSLDLLYVKAGDVDINYKGSWHKVNQTILHEKYQKLELTGGGNQAINDIALLKLENPIIIDNITTKLVQFFDQNEQVYDFDKGEAVGWGLVPVTVDDLDKKNKSTKNAKKRIQRYPSKLMNVQLDIASNNMCFELTPEADLEDQFCTYSLGRAACLGDSGGPFIVDGRQVGVMSWAGSKCFVGQTYSYFVDVTKYRKWIDEHVKLILEQE
ncbi:hypothetical protein QAD02_008923 [Eretmocerus hayati]|uniref:Uncharacterized protein n=1 Tax=Eretmocerus hayati TaxID=131215 RepID=A0ACC2N8N8_9HYME|nr:hypothetical protein QAD02_008923 [Eretmocerus hayati]